MGINNRRHKNNYKEPRIIGLFTTPVLLRKARDRLIHGIIVDPVMCNQPKSLGSLALTSIPLDFNFSSTSGAEIRTLGAKEKKTIFVAGVPGSRLIPGFRLSLRPDYWAL